MSDHTFTITFDDDTTAWLQEQSTQAGTSIPELVAEIVKSERVRGTMDAMAAWVREEEGEAPSIEDVERARAAMLGDDES